MNDLEFAYYNGSNRLSFKYDNLNDIPTNGIARYKNGNIEIEYGYFPLQPIEFQEFLSKKEGTYCREPIYIYENERYINVSYHTYCKIMPIVWTVDMERQRVVADEDFSEYLFQGKKLEEKIKELSQHTKKVKLSDVETDDFKYTSILENKDYSYDKSPLFKTRIDVIHNGCLYMRDLIKFSTEKINEMLNDHDKEKVLYWKNKSILPSEDDYIEIGKKSYKLYIDDQFIVELNNIEDLCVSNFDVQYKDKILYNYKNLTEDIYNDIYNFVYNFLNKYSYLKSDNNFKYMLNKQIDIRNDVINENHDINGNFYDSVAKSVHQRLQSKFISGQIDIKEYNNYFKQVLKKELLRLENDDLSNINIDFLLTKSRKENEVSIHNYFFNIDIRSGQSTNIIVNGDEKYVLPYPCTVKQLDNSHYELSHEFIKYDLYIDGYLVYLNEELVATYLDLGINELEDIKNMAKQVACDEFLNAKNGITYSYVPPSKLLDDYYYLFDRLAHQVKDGKHYGKEKIKKLV